MLKPIKNALYIILLAAELVVGILLMSLLWANDGYIATVVACIVWAALVIWQTVLLVKAEDPVAKGKIKRNIAIFMLTPTVVFIIAVIWLIIGLSQVI